MLTKNQLTIIFYRALSEAKTTSTCKVISGVMFRPSARLRHVQRRQRASNRYSSVLCLPASSALRMKGGTMSHSLSTLALRCSVASSKARTTSVTRNRIGERPLKTGG